MVLRDPAGGLTAYLADGYVEFFGPGEADDQVAWADSTIWESQLSVTFGTALQSDSMVYAYGYAPADVARLVVRMADGEMVSGLTIAGWRGSGIRLWGVGGLPANVVNQSGVVFSYSASGKLIGKVPLWQA
jgi:hypothetical protein